MDSDSKVRQKNGFGCLSVAGPKIRPSRKTVRSRSTIKFPTVDMHSTRVSLRSHVQSRAINRERRQYFIDRGAVLLIDTASVEKQVVWVPRTGNALSKETQQCRCAFRQEKDAQGSPN